MSAWLQEGGGTSTFFEILNGLFEEDGGVEPVVAGVVNLAAVSLTMAAAAVGTTPATVLGGMAADAANADDEDRGV
jgi:hypothetical protein